MSMSLELMVSKAILEGDLMALLIATKAPIYIVYFISHNYIYISKESQVQRQRIWSITCQEKVSTSEPFLQLHLCDLSGILNFSLDVCSFNEKNRATCSNLQTTAPFFFLRQEIKFQHLSCLRLEGDKEQVSAAKQILPVLQNSATVTFMCTKCCITQPSEVSHSWEWRWGELSFGFWLG